KCWYTEALSLFESLDDQSGVNMTLNNLVGHLSRKGTNLSALRNFGYYEPLGSQRKCHHAKTTKRAFAFPYRGGTYRIGSACAFAQRPCRPHRPCQTIAG